MTGALASDYHFQILSQFRDFEISANNNKNNTLGAKALLGSRISGLLVFIRTALTFPEKFGFSPPRVWHHFRRRESGAWNARLCPDDFACVSQKF
jgi:hypothetical protein